MNVGQLLEPLVVKAIKAKGYSRAEAVDRSWRWLARELAVPQEKLKDLDHEQEWTAHAIVERALLPAPKKHKKKVEIPALPFRDPDEKPLGKAFWLQLQKEWGTEFYGRFFGDWTIEQVEGTLAPGQHHIDEIRKANKTALFDAA